MLSGTSGSAGTESWAHCGLCSDLAAPTLAPTVSKPARVRHPSSLAGVALRTIDACFHDLHPAKKLGKHKRGWQFPCHGRRSLIATALIASWPSTL